jgi:fimbrial chaperone protein
MDGRRAFRGFGAFASASALLLAGSASAQSIAIAPVTIALAPGELTTTVTVTNRGSTQTAVQVRPFSWDQAGSEDRLLPTRDLLVSPPIARIDPGKTQTIRILLKKAPQSKEDSYRIFFDDIPAELPSNGVRVALRISIPVFALPPHPVKRELKWEIHATAPGEADLPSRPAQRDSDIVVRKCGDAAGGTRQSLCAAGIRAAFAPQGHSRRAPDRSQSPAERP